jgi:hypothetical protein
MRGRVLFLGSLFLFFVLGCSDDGGTGPGGSNGLSPEATATIGADGGVLEAEDFILDVPAGAFDSEYNLSLYASSSDNPFAENGVSRAFHLEGLPSSFQQPLQVMIGYDGELSGQNYIAFGQETFVHSANQKQTVFQLFDAVEQPDTSRLGKARMADDFVMGELPSMESVDPEADMAAVSHYDTLRSANHHFRIKFPVDYVTFSQAQALCEYPEEAYQKFGAQGMGFSYAARTAWPVDVTVMPLGNETYGRFAASASGNNYSVIDFNRSKIGELDQMRTTAGHEFFHLVQSLYDPRSAYDKAAEGGPYLWLDEASSVWSEEKFTEEQDYVSSARSGHEFAPLEGLQAGAASRPDYHGYGMSAMIKYLVTHYDEGILVDIYDRVAQSEQPMYAVTDPLVHGIENWLPLFFRDYIAGEIYNVSPSLFIYEKSGTFSVETASDTTKTFHSSESGVGSYPDLSAKLFLVQLKYSGIDTSAIMKCTVSSPGIHPHILAFKYLSGELEYLEGGIGSTTVRDIRSLQDEGAHLLVAVVNTSYDQPEYAGSSDIDLKIDLETPQLPELDYEYVEFGMRTLAYFIDENDSITTLDDFYVEGRGDGNFTDTTFTGSWHYTYPWGEVTGSFGAKLDRTGTIVDSFHATGTTYTDGRTSTFTTMGSGIPKQLETTEHTYYWVTGTGACDHITFFTYLSEYEDTWTELFGYTCIQNSEIKITFGYGP